MVEPGYPVGRPENGSSSGELIRYLVWFVFCFSFHGGILSSCRDSSLSRKSNSTGANIRQRNSINFFGRRFAQHPFLG
ncbi:hypothetical protein BDV26DRAFT_257366 [Aspergillus bertholletiae]|uniref:Uncharacterized protein n=1 Tax=Aspergillus bertholletiae TaxID=1226010 RepID=A0A5N7BFB3_9EURO|nr:hypothetical protein BDV26DRAFT_257366 [Aspergillus bertholletiae]